MIARQAELLRPLVDAAQVTDSPLAWVQPSALAASALLLQHGLDLHSDTCPAVIATAWGCSATCWA